MNTPSAFKTAHSILSPMDASKLSGRYETTAEVDGKPVPVLRSIRHAPKDLVLRGSISTPTPKKKARSPTCDDIDSLCDLFQAKTRVAPRRKKPSLKTVARAPQNVQKKVDEGDSVKENLAKALKPISKSNTKSTRFDDSVKKVDPVPVKRSPRRAHSRRIDSRSK